jgi:excisionase family DNA binding protein
LGESVLFFILDIIHHLRSNRRIIKEKLFKVQQIAEYLQVKPSTIYRWTHQEMIPHLKLGNLVRFRMSQLDRWLEKKAVKRSRQLWD